MSDQEIVVVSDKKSAERVNVMAIEIPVAVIGRLIDAEGSHCTIVQLNVNAMPAPRQPARSRPVRDALQRWSPFSPFAGIVAGYGVARAALGRNGKLGIVSICLTAGLASIVWRHATIPIGIAGGLVVSGILFVRTGAYHEYLAAIAEAHGVPPLGVVLRYNIGIMLCRIRALWRR